MKKTREVIKPERKDQIDNAIENNQINDTHDIIELLEQLNLGEKKAKAKQGQSQIHHKKPNSSRLIQGINRSKTPSHH